MSFSTELWLRSTLAKALLLEFSARFSKRWTTATPWTSCTETWSQRTSCLSARLRTQIWKSLTLVYQRSWKVAVCNACRHVQVPLIIFLQKYWLAATTCHAICGVQAVCSTFYSAAIRPSTVTITMRSWRWYSADRSISTARSGTILMWLQRISLKSSLQDLRHVWQQLKPCSTDSCASTSKITRLLTRGAFEA